LPKTAKVGGAEVTWVAYLQLHGPTAEVGRWLPGHQLPEDFVHLGGVDAPTALLLDLKDQVQHLADPLPGEGRDEQERHPLEEGHPLRHGGLPVGGGEGLLLHQVPLVGQDDEAGSCVPGLVRDADVLGVEGLGGVHEQNADVGFVDHPVRSQRRVVLQRVGDLALPP